MASALTALANASVTFLVPGTGVTTDPDTGNVIPAPATVTASFFLRLDSVDTVSSRLGYPGVDQTECLYVGYAMDALDSRIALGTTGTLTFAGETPVPCEVVSIRAPYGKTGLLGSTLATVLGEQVRLLSRAQT